METVELSVGEDVFVVTREWQRQIMALLQLAQSDTIRQFPDSALYADIHLTDVSQGRLIAVIKELRSLKGLGIKDSKAIVDAIRSDGKPYHLGRYSYDEALEIAANFRELGATVRIPSALELLAGEAE